MTDEELLGLYKPVYDYLDAFGIFEVRNLARAFGVKKPTYGRKHDLIMRLIGVACGDVPAGLRAKKGARVKAEDAPEESVARVRELVAECNAKRNYDFSESPVPQYYFRDSGKEPRQFGYGDALIRGVLEPGDGGGYLRAENCEAGEDDPVVPENMIKKFGLRAGDALTGYAERIEGVHMFVQLETVNGAAKSKLQRPAFGSVPAVYPSERISFGAAADPALRAVDLLCPIGKGQRVLVHVPSGADGSAFFRAAAAAAEGMEVCYIAVGCGPEEETDLHERFPQAQVVCSPFGKPASHCVRVVRLALEHAKRAAESGGDVLVLLDSMTALARSYGGALPSSGRRAAGGTDLNVLAECEAVFAVARKLRDAGSVTMLAAVASGGGAADEDVEGKCGPAANAHLWLASSPLRAGGAVPDFSRSYTRRGEELLGETERACAGALRAAAASGGAENILRLLAETENNAQFVAEEELWKNGGRE